ncbi:MAG: hypothetical protein E7575_00475 [Ruminococcaceae bacterium]|nr:hypothetical protein [Oscillospiraceae bacterium]
MKFCTHCGKELFDAAVICPGCGCPTNDQSTQQSFFGQSFANSDPKPYLNVLSEKVKTEAFIWSAVAALQIIFSIVLFASDGEKSIATSLLIIAALNIFSAYSDMQYSKEVVSNPKDIAAKYTPVTGLVIALIYNIIFGGVIGVVGIAFGFMTRSYVMENIRIFRQFDRSNNQQ